jgi:integrase
MGVRGRPGRFAHFDQFVAELPHPMAKRPKYLDGVGVFKGERSTTVWVKLRLANPIEYRGKRRTTSVEIKLGDLRAWSWGQVAAKRDELQGKVDRGEPLEDAQPQTFEVLAKDWLARAKPRVRDYGSLQIHVGKHLLPTFGQKAAPDISVADVNRWVSSQLTNLKPATVKRQMNTFKAIMSDAVRSGHLESNPCSYANSIRGIVPRQRFLDHAELDQLLETAGAIADWLPDFIEWCVHSGMRKGEILDLEWADIQDLKDGRKILLINKAKADLARMVSCTPTMKEILGRQDARRVEGNQHVFPITKWVLRGKWRRLVAMSGVDAVNVHDLRRTHGAHAVAAGVDLRTLQARLGHADLSMLQRVYAPIMAEADAAATEAIEEAFMPRVKGVASER